MNIFSNDFSNDECGFIKTKKLNGQGEIALMRFAFTTAIACHISRNELDLPYQYRYCYKRYSDALRDYENWNGTGHPDGEWIKLKVVNGDIPKLKLETESTIKTIKKVARLTLLNVIKALSHH